MVGATPERENSEERLKQYEMRIAALEETVARLAEGIRAGFPALHYPEPIASALAREQSAAHYHERFFSILDAGEACVKYVAAVIIAVTSSGRTASVDASSLLGKPVALGAWAALIQSSLDRLSRTSTHVADHMRESLFGPGGRLTPPARFLVSELVTLRNRERGHGASQPEGVYESLYRRYASSVHDSIKALGLSRFPLARVELIDVAGELIRYDLRILLGPSPVGKIERVVSRVLVPLGETCLWDGAGGLISLKSIVTYRACPMCGLEHTFFLDQATKQVTKYHTHSGNHRAEGPPLDWIGPVAEKDVT